VILAVTGGKGGVGKSTVAYNLGDALEAVVVDGDLGMADLPTGDGPDLHDVLAGRVEPTAAVDTSGPVALLPCGRSLVGTRGSDPRRLVEALGTVRQAHGRVVVDCPAGMGSDVGLALLAAEAAVLVSTPDDAALADALRARALARELDAGLAAVALNRTTDADTGRVRRAFGAPVVAVPESPAVGRSATAGRPVTGDAGEPFERLAGIVERALARPRAP
jgi:septum site-determining protein MinD